VCIDLDTERREKEKDASYIGERSVPFTTCLASGQLYIYMQLSVLRYGSWGEPCVLVHSRRRFHRGVPSQFTEAHLP